jgi:hypothetical protein
MKAKSDAEKEKMVNSYIDSIYSEGIQKNSTVVFSAHQMSSCRMASSISEGKRILAPVVSLCTFSSAVILDTI